MLMLLLLVVAEMVIVLAENILLQCFQLTLED